MSTLLDKLALGTAQFGLDYGVTNAIGQTPRYEVQRILTFATEHGIDMLDTAAAYGESERVLGSMGMEKFKVVTKLCANSYPERLVRNLEASLCRLKLASVYGLLVHNPDCFEGSFGKSLYQVLKARKVWDQAVKIGVSVYNARQIEKVLEHGSVDIIQLPLSLFDQRLLRNGYLKKLKNAGIEIHARSVFLQGALLESATPPSLTVFSEHFKRYQGFLKVHHLSPLRACLSFAMSVPEVDRIVVGVNDLAQLKEICATNIIRHIDFQELASDDERLITPSKWSKA